MKMPPLPTQINSADPRVLMDALRQVIAYLHALPRFEIKKTNTSTSDSHVLETDVKHVAGLLLIQAYKTLAVDETLAEPALPDWRPVPGGLKDRRDTSEVNHTLTFLVIGTGEGE